MWRLFEAEVLVTRPAKIDYRDGMFHVVEYFSDECRIRKAFTPAVFLAAMQGANAALAKWQTEQIDECAELHRIHPVESLSA